MGWGEPITTTGDLERIEGLLSAAHVPTHDDDRRPLALAARVAWITNRYLDLRHRPRPAHHELGVLIEQVARPAAQRAHDDLAFRAAAATDAVHVVWLAGVEALIADARFRELVHPTIAEETHR